MKEKVPHANDVNLISKLIYIYNNVSNECFPFNLTLYYVFEHKSDFDANLFFFGNSIPESQRKQLDCFTIQGIFNVFKKVRPYDGAWMDACAGAHGTCLRKCKLILIRILIVIPHSYADFFLLNICASSFSLRWFFMIFSTFNTEIAMHTFNFNI